METDFSFNDKYFFPHRQEVSGKTEKRKKKEKENTNSMKARCSFARERARCSFQQ